MARPAAVPAGQAVSKRGVVGSSRDDPRPASPAVDRRRARRGLLHRALYVVVLLGLASMGVVFIALDRVQLPASTRPLETSTFICLADVPAGRCGPDTAVARLSAKENRVVLRYDEIPAQLVAAVIAAEDRTFFEHNGIDPTGIARALWSDLVSDSASRQGGSTITQQYVKTVYLTREQTISRKLREAAMAIKLERKVSKSEILERYLNEVYFGRGAYGVEAAARAYFGTGVAKLRLDQSAYLAGLIRAPELADATRNVDEATRRRRTVLDAMIETGAITREQRDEADRVPFEGIVLPRPVESDGVFVSQAFADVGGEYVVDWVRRQLLRRFGEQRVFGGGLRVSLTIDPLLQRTAFGSIASKLDKADDPSAALVSVDSNGHIVALVGGSSYGDSSTNLALGTEGGGTGRSPGSTFKPVALAAFVEKGYSLDSLFQATSPMPFKGLVDPVRNFDDEQYPVIDVRTATAHSVNTAFVQIAEKAGFKKIPEMAKRLGITSPIKPEALAVIGASGEVSPLEMASAYSTFARRGLHVDPLIVQRVTDTPGEVLYEAGEPVKTQVIAPEVADTVTDALKRVVTEGTGTAAKLDKVEAVGKTGTTDNNADAWFVGYTCHLTTAVWMGFPAGSLPMTAVHGIKVTGGTFPAQIWHDFMTFATSAQGPCEYPSVNAGTEALNPELATTTTTTPATTAAPATTVPATAPPATPAPTAAPAAPAPAAAAAAAPG